MFGLGKRKNDEEQSQDSKINPNNLASEESPEVDVKMQESELPEEQVKQEDLAPPPLTWREEKTLKRSRYEQKIANNSRFKNSYVLRNKKTGQIVELRAASSFHACNIIGWRLRHVDVLAIQPIEQEEQETTKANGEKVVKREKTSPEEYETTASSTI